MCHAEVLFADNFCFEHDLKPRASNHHDLTQIFANYKCCAVTFNEVDTGWTLQARNTSYNLPLCAK